MKKVKGNVIGGRRNKSYFEALIKGASRVDQQLPLVHIHGC